MSKQGKSSKIIKKAKKKYSNEGESLQELIGNDLIDKLYYDLRIYDYDIDEVLNFIKLNNIQYDEDFLNSILDYINEYDYNFENLNEKIRIKYKNKYHYVFTNTLNLLRYTPNGHIESVVHNLIESDFGVNKWDIRINESNLLKQIFDFLITNIQTSDDFIIKIIDFSKQEMSVITYYFLLALTDHKKIISNNFLKYFVRKSYQNKKDKKYDDSDTEFDESDVEDDAEDDVEDDVKDHTEDDVKDHILDEEENSNQILIDIQRNETLSILFEKMKIIPDENFCNMVLENHDEELFKYLLDRNLLIISNKSLAYAYRGCSYYIVSTFIDMKYVPTIDDLRELKKNNKEIINLSLMMGIKINYNLISEFIPKKIYFDKLNNHNLEYGEELYFECYKITGLCVSKYCKPLKNDINNNFSDMYEYYISQMNNNIVKFRYDFKIKKIEDLKKIISNNKLIPDQYCYDYSFDNENWEHIVEWLEKDFNLKPTTFTFIRLRASNSGNWKSREESYYGNEIKRKQLYNKYFYYNTNFHTNTNLKEIYINKNLYEQNIQNITKQGNNLFKISIKKRIGKLNQKLKKN